MTIDPPVRMLDVALRGVGAKTSTAGGFALLFLTNKIERIPKFDPPWRVNRHSTVVIFLNEASTPT